MSSLQLDYPIALKLSAPDKKVLLVGAGAIAEGRLAGLLEVGARVHVVSPTVTAKIRALALAGRVELSERPYRAGDCAGAQLVFTATDSRDVSRAVVEEARALGVLANAADIPELCDFNVPSVGRQGPIAVAVSTAGQAPGLAAFLRRRLMRRVGPEFGFLARLFGQMRRRLPPGKPRTELLARLLESAVTGKLAAGDRAGARRTRRQSVLTSSSTSTGAVSP